MSLVGSKQRASTPDAAAVRDEARALSWAELDALLNRATNALLRLDLDPDRRVAVFAENSVNTVVAYLAEILAG
ncbi:MAG: AMP-binding protein, partial [Solirubrobacteraceae bacterium]